MLRVAHKMRLAKTVLYTFSDAPKPKAKSINHMHHIR